MKKSIVLISVSFIALMSPARTKEELIEQLLLVSNAEAQFDELRETVISTAGKELPDDLKGVILKHCTWENMKEFRTKIIDECYTVEDLEMAIKLYDDPEFREFRKNAPAHDSLVATAIEVPLEKKARSNADAWKSWDETKKQIYLDAYKAGASSAIEMIQENFESETALDEPLSEIREKVEQPTYTKKLEDAVTDLYLAPANEHILIADALILSEQMLHVKDITNQLLAARARGWEAFKKKRSNQDLQPTAKITDKPGGVQDTDQQ